MTAAEFIKVRHPQDYDDIPQWHIDELEAYAAQQIADKIVSERLKNAPKNCPKAAQCAHVEGGMKCPPNVICPI